jgi:hypothetical protein
LYKTEHKQKEKIMGNYAAGQQIVAVALALWEVREKTGMTALQILDKACEPFARVDVSFNDEVDPPEPFGQILIAAFAPDYHEDPNAEGDENWERWSTQIYEPFWKRYNLG